MSNVFRKKDFRLEKNIIQCGVAKSGNYWLNRIIMEILNTKGVTNESIIKKDSNYTSLSRLKLSFEGQVDIDTIEIKPNGVDLVVSKVYRRPLQPEEFKDGNHLLWTHSIYNKGWQSVVGVKDIVIYILRDPRDVFLSKINFVFSDYGKTYLGNKGNKESFRKSRLYSSTYAWIENVIRFLEYHRDTNDNTMIVVYEDLLRDTVSGIMSLGKCVFSDFDQKKAVEISDKVSANSLRSKSTGHVGKNIVVSKWKRSLTKRELNWFQYVFRDLLDFFEQDKSQDFLHENIDLIINKLREAKMRSLMSPNLYLSLLNDKRSIREIVKKFLMYNKK